MVEILDFAETAGPFAPVLSATTKGFDEFMIFSLGEWMSGKIFTSVHMNNLVYNTCWEDPRLDKIALELGPDDDVLVITSAGCNALSYALEAPRSVHAVDMNYHQNALLELKIAGIKELDYETFFQIFGQGHHDEIKDLYRRKLRSHLSPKSREFWDKKIRKFFGGRRSFYFRGTSGYFARWINTYISKIGRVRKDVNLLLDAKDIETQRKYWPKIRKKLWSRSIRFLVNRDTSLSMLGVPRAQRLQIEKTYQGQVAKFAEECLDAVFGDLPVADNYFWRLYANGSYSKECCPEYLEKKNFEALKAGLVDRIHVYTDTVEGFLRKYDGTISRFVLLDHMDWLSDKLYDALVSEWDAIIQKSAPRPRILWRSGGLDTSYIPTIPIEINGQKKELGEILQFHKEQAAELHKKDRVHTYGSFYIADLLND